tara:strand:+ start:230 stop:469 length:240 start_codon:yes stop_codon:yes gene_type:complete
MKKELLKEMIREELRALLSEQKAGDVLMSLSKSGAFDDVKDEKSLFDLLKGFLGMASQNVEKDDAKKAVADIARMAAKE